MEFKGDVIITDPCYIIKDNENNDWKKCGYGECMEAQLEELNKLDSTRWDLIKKYGSDSVQAKIYDDKIADATVDIKSIGQFCADAGLVGVFLLDEVLKYNPEFDWWVSRPWTTTLIKDFDGEINYYVSNDDSAHIIGVGNVNFYTT